MTRVPTRMEPKGFWQSALQNGQSRALTGRRTEHDMRALFLIAVIGAGLIATLNYPFAGVLLWTWFTCMDPHQEAYGFAQSAPFNFIIACVTIAAWLLSKERKWPPVDATFVLILAFLAWITLNGYFAVDPAW